MPADANHHSSWDDYRSLTQNQVAILLISIAFVALCGITYELIIGAVSTYLLGNSVYQFSITIGLFMFAMGIGSYLSKYFLRNLLASFIIVEIWVALIGGVCSICLFVVYASLHALYVPIMYCFIIVIGALVGLEIPLLTRILTEKQAIRKSIANVLSLDYIGALIGSVVFPLLLLPYAGLVRSSFIIGLVNILTAIVNLYFFRPHLPHTRLLVWMSVSVCLALCIATVMGTRITSFAENQLYQDQVIYKTQTPYQKIVFTQHNLTGQYRMYIDGHIQFSQKDEHRYHEALVHPVMSLPGAKSKVLILGGGDGLAAREILKYAQVRSVELVDIDPAITTFSANFPALKTMNANSLQDPRVKIIHADAFSYMNRSGLTYDRIIADLPDPHNEALSKLYSKEFYRMLKASLSETGALVTQSSSPFYTRQVYWSIRNTLRAAGLQTYSYHVAIPSFGIWGFHIAAHVPMQTPHFTLSVPTRFITTDVIRAASIFANDIAEVDAPSNSVFHPELYMLYIAESSM